MVAGKVRNSQLASFAFLALCAVVPSVAQKSRALRDRDGDEVGKGTRELTAGKGDVPSHDVPKAQPPCCKHEGMGSPPTAAFPTVVEGFSRWFSTQHKLDTKILPAACWVWPTKER